eukprot:2435291-Ditylum_brightwellii.AAC.1
MSKRLSDVPQVPNHHPSGRVVSGTDAVIEAGTGLQGYGRSNNGALAIADPSSVLPSSNEAESIVEPGTIADEKENPNITSEATGGFQDKGEHEYSSPHKPTSLTSKDNNDP